MKPNTYSQISIQAVFAVKYRESLITKDWRDDLHKYISGIVNGMGAKSLAVGGWHDHIHVFFGMPPSISVADMLKDIKGDSSTWINKQGFLEKKFRWQDGYGAFSYSKSHRDRVIKYIMNQEQHHAKKTFRQEYLTLLRKFEVEYDERYLFEFFD